MEHGMETVGTQRMCSSRPVHFTSIAESNYILNNSAEF